MGPWAGVGMSQTGFVHQGRFLQSCSKSHKVPFSDLFLPVSLLRAILCLAAVPHGARAAFQGAMQPHRPGVVAKPSTVRALQQEEKISYASTCYNY